MGRAATREGRATTITAGTRSRNKVTTLQSASTLRSRGPFTTALTTGHHKVSMVHHPSRSPRQLRVLLELAVRMRTDHQVACQSLPFSPVLSSLVFQPYYPAPAIIAMMAHRPECQHLQSLPILATIRKERTMVTMSITITTTTTMTTTRSQNRSKQC